VLGHSSGVGEPCLEDLACDGREEVGIGAGPDEVVLVGVLGGAAAAGVDHHDLAAALAYGAHAPAIVGRRHQAAVRRQRVRTQHQHVVGPVDVRNRDREERPEHEPGGHLLRHLVDRAGTEDIAGAERLQQHAAVQRERQVVHARVAQVDADRVPPVLLEDRHQPPLYLLERFFPTRLDELAAPAHQWRPQPVGVVVHGGDAAALRADEAVGEDVVFVTAHAFDAAVVAKP
jgi:hypothetical protein